ncbi:pilus assembly protein TadG-related protein [Mumia sp. DW29H23]|uniref:pilus assembly protein TadG-related protein n=1 Tax=Mumia sp. DW29H23 TaxID=3421241 RepID=UPI003D690594
MSAARPAGTPVRSEGGQVTVMIVGFFVVAGLVVAMAVNASTAYLAQRRLADLADGAALAASEGVARASLYGAGEGTIALDAGAARAVVGDYLRTTGADAGVDSLVWDVEQTGDAVRVRLRGTVRMPLAPPGWDGTTQVDADAVVELRIS